MPPSIQFKTLLILLTSISLAFAQRPVGTLQFVGPDTTNCTASFSCSDYTVQCPPPLREDHPTTVILGRWTVPNPIALVVFFSGHAGQAWWDNTQLSHQFLAQLHDAGYDLVQVRFTGSGWPDSSGLPQGFEVLAVRPATVIAWLHDNWLSAGEKYFVTGISEGSAAIGYAASSYAVPQIDKLVFISGPPMADLSDGCLEVPGYGYVVNAETYLVDQPWGYQQGDCGACCQHLQSWTQTWIDNSVETGGTSYFYPNTQVTFILGDLEEPTILNHARKLYDVFNSNAQPNLSWTLVPNMSHAIQESQAGLDVLFNLLTCLTCSPRATVADFNGDGHPDFVLQNTITRQTAIWYLNNNVLMAGGLGPTLPIGWSLAATADFNRDSHPDYALFAPITEQTVIGYLSGPTVIGAAYGPTLPGGWELVATADFDGDGYPDYVLYNAGSRQTAIWYLNNNVFVGGAFGPTLTAGWSLIGVADFNRDGYPDYALFDSITGQTAIWYLSGPTLIGTANGPTVPTGWALVGTADFNGDGYPDYLLYNPASRQTAIWYLSNNVYIGSAYGPTLPAGWSLFAQ